VEKAIKETKNKKATADDDVPEVVLKVLEEWSQNNDTSDQQYI
jgi:hypothetical protein